MELEIFEALTAANVPADKARAAAASVKKEMNEQFALHSAQLATRVDLSETKIEIIKWCVGSMFTAVALFATITKIWH